MTRVHATALGPLLAVALAGCRNSKAAAREVGDSTANARVEGPRVILPEGSPQLASLSATAAAPAVPQPVRLNGRMVWNEDVTVRIFSPFAGRVVNVAVDAGQPVRPGDVLTTIASPDFGQAQADARRAATDLALAERTLARLADLLRHGVVAQKDVDAAQADVARARAEQQRAEARLALYGVDSTSANQVFPLKTPLGGVVVERNLSPGQEVRPDQMLANAPALFAPLFVVSDPAQLWVELDLAERDVSAVKPGAGLAVRASAWPDRVFRGRVVLVSSEVDPSTRTVKVRGTVANPRRLLKAEMLVTVDASGAQPQGPVVPVAAVILQGDAHVVFVEESPGRYRRAEVRVGSERDGVVPVEAGLQPGERVVAAGSLLLEQLFPALAHS